MAAQPVTEQGRQTRQRIVAAAADVVAEKGALGASLDDVGARAAASRSQLYHYFDDKTDLLRAVAEATNDTVLDGQETLFAGLDTWDGLRAMGRRPRRAARAAGRARGLPDRQPRRPARRTRRRHPGRARLGLRPLGSHIRAGLAAMVASGELRPDTDVDWLAASHPGQPPRWPHAHPGPPRPPGTPPSPRRRPRPHRHLPADPLSQVRLIEPAEKLYLPF